MALHGWLCCCKITSGRKSVTLDLAKITHADFDPCIGRSFAIELDDDTVVALELDSVEVRSGSGAPEEKRRPFSLIFRGPQAPSLPQRIYRMTNERLGELALFLVPVGPENNQMLYEVVFN